jgi:hypothetical protein
MSTMILTCVKGKNNLLMAGVAELYFTPGMRIADVTYGKGNFWKNIDTKQFDFHPSDILSGVDLRILPYPDASFDVLILDPPYVHSAGSFKINGTYNNSSVTGNFSTVIELYRAGMQEACRVLNKQGLLLVKCQDIVEGRMQRWSHIIIEKMARDLGFKAVDLFILHQNTIPMNRVKRWCKQVHARRNHSYLWVFKRVIRGNKNHAK